MNRGGEARLPFDVEFQISLLRLLLEDSQFASAVSDYIEPSYFENEVLSWAYGFARWYRSQYESFPSVRVLQQQIRSLDPALQPMYEAVVERIQEASLADVRWMQDKVLDFVKRQVFVRGFHEARGLFNSGRDVEAYDLMMARLETIYNTIVAPHDERDFFETLAERQEERFRFDPSRDSVGTGLPEIDDVLAGGLSEGELGIWIGDAKGGKSTLLVKMGTAATSLQHRKVAHFVLEGMRQRIEDRYDSSFMDEYYHSVRRADISGDKFSKTQQLYQSMRGLLKIRGFSADWDYSIVDVHSDLKRWEKVEGWVPDLIIIDYGDLIRGRDRTYPNEREKQKAAYRDMVSLANRGYRIWTASQAQRPDKGSEDKVSVIRPRQIADCYEKVRVAHFLGSINWTRTEREQKIVRLHAAVYRENEADKTIPYYCDFGKMRILPLTEGLGWDPNRNSQLTQCGVRV